MKIKEYEDLEGIFKNLEKSIEKAIAKNKEYIPSIHSDSISIFNFPFKELDKKQENMSKRELLRYYFSDEMIEYICRDRIYIKHEPDHLYYHVHLFLPMYRRKDFSEIKRKLKEEGLIKKIHKTKWFRKKESWEQNFTRFAANYGYKVKPGERLVSNTPIALDIKTDSTYDNFLALKLITNDKLRLNDLCYIAFTFVPTYFKLKKDTILQVVKQFDELNLKKLISQSKKW